MPNDAGETRAVVAHAARRARANFERVGAPRVLRVVQNSREEQGEGVEGGGRVREGAHEGAPPQQLPARVRHVERVPGAHTACQSKAGKR